MPRPPKSWIVLPALLVAAFVAGRHSLAQETPEKTVKALRYTILWGESALDISHGGGRWVQEIYFPKEKVACVLVSRWPTDLARPAPRLCAYRADGPRNHLTGFKNAKPSVIEEIDVPGDVAQEILRLAELTERQERETRRLGREVARRGLMKELSK